MSNSSDQSITIESHSFQKGWSQVMQKDIADVKKEIMDALHVVANPTFYSRLYGNVTPKQSEIHAIEAVFHSHGITEIWGE